ncbi:SDR family NAD(P)-dependent oxidoreductase [Streptomyces sp. NPDC096339]|uniref:SDR family NAD(P)-dependent oxidoreductase n=1 Tax=Streptomyces sp. NPDC096339 TaxID=3366086 RepID=UPI003811A140
MSVAIVTGASRGLGRALAGELAARGWDLVLSARGAGALEEAAAESAKAGGGAARSASMRGGGRATGGRVVAVAGDVSSAAHRAALVAAARELGGLDLLVNNAGVLGAEPLVPLAEHALDGLREAFEVNVVGPLGLLQEGLPLLRASAAGAVLNISSDAAVVPYATWGAYGATKAAGDLMSAVLAGEEPGLRVWWADPGSMRTRMMAAAEPGEDLTGLPAPEEVAPVLLALLDRWLPSGRYTADRLAAGGVAAGEGGGGADGAPGGVPDGVAGVGATGAEGSL